MIDMKKLSQCFEDAGIYVNISDLEVDSDIDLRDFIASSIQFISIVISIEKNFDIEFSDEYLVIDTFSSFKNLVVLIEKFQKQKNSEK
ncbi:MAG: hypothetical protein IKP68_02250 [Clostridia bacterium]|nr:hypothetical protein [Clostridia bacterium]